MENNFETAEKSRLDKLLGYFFFGCNIPFVIAESEHFKKFIRALNPNYTIPTRKTIANTILDACYVELQESIVQTKTKNAVLLIDGWKNKSANSKKVVAMLKLEEKYIYLQSWDFNIIRETGEALADVVNECTRIALEKYNLNIIGVVSDNASNMMSMGRMVNIWHTTCSSHSANLLCKSLIDNEFASKVNSLLKEFKNPSLETQLLQRGGNRMVLIAETRWCSHRDAFRRCLKNLGLMREIARDQQIHVLSDQNNNLLFDPNFENQLMDNLLFLDPICQLTNISQKADTSLADTTELWLNLYIINDNPNHDRLISDRKKKVINSLGLAANYLHPVYRGTSFQNNDEYITQVKNFFKENLCNEGLEELAQFENKQGAFEIIFEKNYQSPQIFWKAATVFYPQLGKLALALQSLCGSTARLERLFSEWAYVHDPKRNRLSPERSSKLISLYYDTRLRDAIMREENEDFGCNVD